MNGYNYWYLLVLNSAHAYANQLRFSARSGGSEVHAYSGPANTLALANTWYHCAGTMAGNSNKYAYVNGTPGGVNTTARTPAGINTIAYGAFKRASAPTFYVSGMLGEAAVWNVALLPAEIAILAKGFSPLFIRPQNLVSYRPLIREGAAGVYRDIIPIPIN